MSDDIETRRERLQELRSDLREARERESELSERIAEATASGDEPDDLREERREVQDRVRDLEAAIPVLAQRIEDAERGELRDRAADRVQTIRKKVGGIAGQTPEMIERAEELKEKLAATAEWLWTAPYRRQELIREARGLADRFGLERPEFRTIPGNAHAAGVDAAKVKQEMQTPRGSISGDVREVVGHLRDYYGIESPTLELLDELEALDAEMPKPPEPEPEEDEGDVPDHLKWPGGHSVPEAAEEEDDEVPAEALASPGSLPGAGYVEDMEVEEA